MSAAWVEPPEDTVAGVESLGAEPETPSCGGTSERGASLEDRIVAGQDQVRRGLEQLAELQATHREHLALAREFIGERRAAAARHGEVAPWE